MFRRQGAHDAAESLVEDLLKTEQAWTGDTEILASASCNDTMS